VAQMAFEFVEEGNETFRVVAALPGLEEQAAAAAVPTVADRRADGHLLPVESMDQDRRFTFRGPGSADRGTLGNAAFVLEEDPGFPAASVFFTAGQRSFSQSSTFFPFRSRACLAGRCRVQSIAPRIFHT